MATKLVETKGGALDERSKEMIFDGASVSQLVEIFKLDARTIAKKIRALTPSGKRHGYPIYHIRDVAKYVVDPVGNLEDKIKRMHHRDLPPMLLKEFWAGQNARLKFEEDQGDLWRTEVVLQHYAEAFKTMRTEILLVADAIDRTAEMSDRQRALLRKTMDGMLKNLRTALVDKFKNEPDRNFETERPTPEAGMDQGAGGDSSGDGERGEDRGYQVGTADGL